MGAGRGLDPMITGRGWRLVDQFCRNSVPWFPAISSKGQLEGTSRNEGLASQLTVTSLSVISDAGDVNGSGFRVGMQALCNEIALKGRSAAR